jgi:hypothetical protein
VLGKVTFSNLWLWIAAYTGNVTNKTFTTGNAFNGTLGATTPAAVTATALYVNPGVLGTVAGNSTLASTLQISSGNADLLRSYDYRLLNGADHLTSELRIQRRIDVSDMGYIGFRSGALVLGYLNTEYLRVAESGLVTMQNGLAVTGAISSTAGISGTTASFTGPVSLINATQPTPAAGYTTIYPKADKLLYYKDDAGVERLLADNKGPAFSAYKSAAQTIADSIITKVIFGGKEFDTANAFDNVTNNRFKPLVAGYYSISAQVYPSTNTTYCQTMLYKNNLLVKRSISSGVNTGPLLSALIYLDGVNDYIELFGYMSGTTPAITNDASLTFFQAFLARSA